MRTFVANRQRGLWSWKGSKTLNEQIRLSGLLGTVLVLYNKRTLKELGQISLILLSIFG